MTTTGKTKRIADITFDVMFPPREDKLCRCGCGKTRVRVWASPDCMHRCVSEFKFRKGYSDEIRRQVFIRDKGVCAACKLDTTTVRKELRMAISRLFKSTGAHCNGQVQDELDALFRPWIEKGFKSPRGPDGDWWQADHIVPVVEGGGECGLENFRTLCTPCHKRETRALAARRADRRRRGEVLELIILPEVAKIVVEKMEPTEKTPRLSANLRSPQPEDFRPPAGNRLTFV